jgi:hypothetical protein
VKSLGAIIVPQLFRHVLERRVPMVRPNDAGDRHELRVGACL